MSEISDMSTVLQESLLLSSLYEYSQENQLQQIQNQLQEMPAVLNKDTITKLREGEYDISLREYTNMSTYNTMMTALYGNNSANSFQNTLNFLTNSAENELANAKSFVNSMKANGMSSETAVKTYAALQKYSMMSSFGNYNFIKATA